MAISTVSFNNTPQAVDDYYSFTQTGLYADVQCTITLAVMANDLGGQAKTLYSLDDGEENEGSATSADLLVKDAVDTDNFSQNGALIEIRADGKVAYSMTTDSMAHFQYLAAGEIGHDSFTYAIRLSNGALSWATATIEIRGVNDAAVISGDGSGAVLEAASPGTPTASGTLVATDVDNPDNLFQPDSGATTYGSFAVDVDGNWTYTLNDGNPAVDALNVGGTLPDSFVVKSADGTEHLVTITINGSNDAPTTTPVALVAIDEDSGARLITQAELLDNAADIDSPSLTATDLSIAAGNGELLDNGDGTWTYTPAADDDGDVSFNYSITDGSASVAGSATLDINPVNDAPTTTPVALAAIDEDSGARLITQAELLANAADIDSPSLTATDLSIAAGNGELLDNGDGTWTYTPAADDDTEVSFNYSITDGDLTANGSATLDINPVNDAPTAADGAASTDEDSPIITGTLPAASDIEGDSVTYALGATHAANGTVVVYADGTFDYSPNENVNGEDSFSFVVDDGNGGSNEYSYTVTVDPVNDAPLVTATDTLSYTENQAASAINSSLTVADTDSPNLSGAKASLSGNFHAGEDVLGFGNQNGITGSYDAVTGVLTLSGTASVANYQAALRSVTYFNASEGPSGDTRTISFQVDDGALLSNIATGSVEVTPVDDGPSIIANSQVNYSTQNSNAEVAFISGFSFQDADSGSNNVTVTINSNNVGDALNVLTGSGVTTAGAGTSVLTLTGTIADINAFIAGDHIKWNPLGNNSPSQDFTISIDDNGVLAGGNLASKTVRYAFTSLGLSGSANVVSFAGWSLNALNANALGGDDVITTTWHNGPSATAVSYVGGQPTSTPGDSITLAFTAGQLEEILGNSTFRAALGGYLDGSPSGATLDLDATSWNATVSGFETAKLALASGNDGIVTYAAVGSSLPAYLAGLTGDGGDNLRVGTAAGETLSGDAGNDILVGMGGNDLLLGGIGSDLLLGSAGNDVLTGGAGNDILAGGNGADSLVFGETGALNVDAVIDYSYVEGDSLDLSALLDANFDFGAGSLVADFVQLVQAGSSITVQVDTDGTANGVNFADVAVLTNYGTSGSDLVNTWFGDVEQTLTV